MRKLKVKKVEQGVKVIKSKGSVFNQVSSFMIFLLTEMAQFGSFRNLGKGKIHSSLFKKKNGTLCR